MGRSVFMYALVGIEVVAIGEYYGVGRVYLLRRLK